MKTTLSIVALAVLMLMACATTAPSPAPAVESSISLRGSAATVEDLVGEFLIAVEAGDEQHLSRIALDETEFEAIVWPELPASRPETNLTPEFVWQQYDMRSQAYRARLLGALAGRSYRLDKVEFTGEPRHYEKFVLLDDPVLTLIAEDGSRETRMLFGAIIEHEGHYKIYGYSTD